MVDAAEVVGALVDALREAVDELRRYALDDAVAHDDGSCGARSDPEGSIAPVVGQAEAALALAERWLGRT